MGGFAKCCCGDCCLTDPNMPYTSVTLIAPAENCDGGPGGGVGAGFGEGEGPPPPEANFETVGCCHQVEFVLNCQPQVENCELWAKRKTDWGFTVKYYGARKGYISTDDEDDCECECTLWQTKTIAATETVRVFFGQKYQLIRLRVNVGQVKIQCDGDSTASCKFYIAVTYIYQIYEGNSLPIQYLQVEKTCTGNYEPQPECSMSTNWTEERGEDTDACPEGVINYLPEENITITRAKFYDTLPTGQVTIGQNDGVPFSCCDNKTGCVVTQPSCGLSFGNSRCLTAVPNHPEIGSCALHSIVQNGVIVGVQCYELKVNGMYSPAPYTAECVSNIGGGSVDFCYIDFDFSCEGQTLGVDKFVVNASSSPVNDGIEGDNICSTLDVDYVNPGVVSGPFCVEGSNIGPSLNGCIVEGCCIERGFGLGAYNDLCFVFDLFCGRKIENYTCSTVRTDYTVGDVCLPLPNVTLEFA